MPGTNYDRFLASVAKRADAIAMTSPSPRRATSNDRLAVARLVHASTNAWYETHGDGPAFTCAPEDCAVYFDTYEALDPGHCLVIDGEQPGTLRGSCFVHPRTTHLALGIMNVAPAAFGQGVAGRLLDHICGLADAAGLPLRLVSSAGNLDSFSLYNTRGFVPIQVFQDVLFEVPAQGLAAPPEAGLTLRTARLEDVPALAALEHALHGLDRARDLEFFAQDPLGCFRLFVATRRDGSPAGWLASVRHPATAMLGPAVAADEDSAFALIRHALDAHHKGGACVAVVPSDRPKLVQRVRSLGGRNIELHLAQVRAPRDATGRSLDTGPQQAPAAPVVVLPTFLPETG